MLKILATCFLSFVITGSASGIVSIDTYGAAYDTSSINYSEQEVNWFWVGFIGRHEMIKIETCEDLGIQSIQQLSRMYDANTLTDFTFSESFSTVVTTTVSTTIQVSSSISTGLQVQAGIPGAKITDNAKVESVYTIASTSTYTASETKTSSVTYTVKQEIVDGKVFALCMAAHVYKVTWQTWMWDDWWWGDFEVEDSRSTQVAYITVDPYVTIMYNDWSLA